jgi:MEKK4 N-terminal
MVQLIASCIYMCTHLCRWFFMVHRLNMMRAKEALRKPEGELGKNCASKEIGSASWKTAFDDTPWEEQSINILGEQQPDESTDELQRYGIWSPEFRSLNLPQYRSLYLFLCRIPLDVIREALSIRLAEKPSEPSEVKQIKAYYY